MDLVKWDPFREIEEVADRWTRLLGRRSSTSLPSGREAVTSADWIPAVDISETDAEYIVRVELPGIEKKDVKVSVSGDVLWIQGERRQEKEEETERHHRVERAYGSFLRTFALPDDVQDEKLSAEFRNGVLHVRLPKAETPKPMTREIEVK